MQSLMFGLWFLSAVNSDSLRVPRSYLDYACVCSYIPAALHLASVVRADSQ